MTTGMAWRPVSNMVTPENKVTNGVAWRPVSHGVSPKGTFNLFKASKITSKFFKARKNSKFLTCSSKFLTCSKSEEQFFDLFKVGTMTCSKATKFLTRFSSIVNEAIKTTSSQSIFFTKRF